MSRKGSSERVALQDPLREEEMVSCVYCRSKSKAKTRGHQKWREIRSSTMCPLYWYHMVPHTDTPGTVLETKICLINKVYAIFYNKAIVNIIEIFGNIPIFILQQKSRVPTAELYLRKYHLSMLSTVCENKLFSSATLYSLHP